MKVAIVHDHLAQDGGAERVVQAFQQLYPHAPIYALVYNPDRAHPAFRSSQIHTSFIQRLPGGVRFHQWYLPLMPTAVERYDLSDYDIVISSAASFAKGVITLPRTLHVSYIHSPTRYLWSDTIRYVDDLPYAKPFRSIAPIFLSRIRMWDRMAADRPDVLIANSATTHHRIEKYYRRPSTIIHPPVATERFSVGQGQGGYYVTGGRLVKYKRFDLVIRAFNKLGLALKVYGTGPAENELREMAKPNIEFVGRVADQDLNKLYDEAVAFINPQEEDFGITPVEAMATGRPVIAYAAGGALETVKAGLSGIFFQEQEWEALADCILRFEPETYKPADIRRHAETFSTATFLKTFSTFVDGAWQAHQKSVV